MEDREAAKPGARGVLIAALVLAFGASAPAAAPPAIAAIRAQFWLEGSGRLSGDLLQPDFKAWNSVIGEGGAGEPASDVLISVRLRAPGDQLLPGTLKISVTGPRGRVLAERRFKGDLLAHGGGVWKAMWLPDAGCAGALRIVATYGSLRRTAALNLPCGE